VAQTDRCLQGNSIDANLKKLAESKDEQTEKEALEVVERNVKELKDALHTI
jgi:hypothetical protein